MSGQERVADPVTFTLENLHLLRAWDVLRYWPAALIVVGVLHILQSRASGGRIGGGIWILIGTTMLGNRAGWWDVSVWNFWPLVLVLVVALPVPQAAVPVPAAVPPP